MVEVLVLQEVVAQVIDLGVVGEVMDLHLRERVNLLLDLGLFKVVEDLRDVVEEEQGQKYHLEIVVGKVEVEGEEEEREGTEGVVVIFSSNEGSECFI